MSAALAPWLADALVLLSLALMSIAVYGMLWLPDIYTRLHAAGKGIVIGNLLLVLAAPLTGAPAVVAREILIGAFLLLTTPISAHAIGQAALRRRERQRTPGALDESGLGLAGAAEGAPDQAAGLPTREIKD